MRRLAIVVSIILVVLILLSTGRSPEANLAYLDLVRGLANDSASQEHLSRFLTWAQNAAQSAPHRNAALYGLGLLAVRERTLPQPYWQRGDYRSLLNTDHGDLLLSTMIGLVQTEADIRFVGDMLQEPGRSSWLARSAATTKEYTLGDASVVETYLRVLEETGDLSSLDRATRERLAKVYTWVAHEYYWPQGRCEDAMQYIDVALTLVPDGADELCAKGRLLFDLGQVDAGLELTRRAVALHPRSATAWLSVGILHAGLGKLPESENALRRSLALDSNNPSVWMILGHVLRLQGRCAEALPYARRAAEEMPDHPGALHYLGDVYWCLDDRPQARAAYRRLVAVDPGSYESVKDRIQ